MKSQLLSQSQGRSPSRKGKLNGKAQPFLTSGGEADSKENLAKKFAEAAVRRDQSLLIKNGTLEIRSAKLGAARSADLRITPYLTKDGGSEVSLPPFSIRVASTES